MPRRIPTPDEQRRGREKAAALLTNRLRRPTGGWGMANRPAPTTPTKPTKPKGA